MEAKNLIYTQLGFPFRPKLSGWEFLDDAGDYSNLSTIDWSNDHSKHARLTRGIDIIVDKLDLAGGWRDDKESFKKHKLSSNHAKICADALINAELVGAPSHGLSRLKMYCDRINKI